MVKGETVMPVPEGNITTTEILVPEVVPLEETIALLRSDAEEAVKEYTEGIDDLPEL
jgi:hypothetical protein